MAVEFRGPDIPLLEAAADLSGSQYYAVAIDSNGRAALATIAGQRVVGILQDQPKQYENATVRYRDGSKAHIGGTVAKGDKLTVDSSSRLVTSTLSTDFIVAVALDAGTVDQVISVLLFH